MNKLSEQLKEFRLMFDDLAEGEFKDEPCFGFVMNKVAIIHKFSLMAKKLEDQIPVWNNAINNPKETGYYFVVRKENPIPTARLFDGKEWKSSATILLWMPIPPLKEV